MRHVGRIATVCAFATLILLLVTTVAQSATGGCTAGFMIGPTSSTPATLASGTETITTQVCAGSAAPDVIVGVEIHDASGAAVAKQFFPGQTFAAGETKSYSWPYAVSAGLASGTYTVTVGVYSGDWSTLYAFDWRAATFGVQRSGSGSGCPGGFTGGFTAGFTMLAIGATPSPVAPGGTETITTQLCSANARSDVVVGLEIHDAADAAVAKQFFTGQVFAATETKSYSWPYGIPPTLPAGTYYVKVGVYSGDWSTLYLFAQGPPFTLQGSGTAECTGGFTIGPTNATPGAVARGATETISTQVCSGSPASNIIVGVEIHDASGAAVAKQFFTGQAFAVGETKGYTWLYAVPAGLATGTYTVTVGVYSGDWSTLYSFEWRAAAFTVQ